MSKYILSIFLLSILNVLLFFDKSLGVSVIIFMIPMLYYLYNFMKENGKIKNKKGLLFAVPIILLSLTYLIFNNKLFNVLNCLAIFVLYILMYIYTINPTYNFIELLKNSMKLIFEPFTFIGRFFRVSKTKIAEKLRITDKSKKVIKSLLIVIPISIIIIILLSSADMVFNRVFSNIYNHIREFFELEIFNHLIGRIFTFIVVFFAIGISGMYILFAYPGEKNKEVSNNKKRDLLTIKLLLTVLNVVYLIFDFIQIKSLILHSLSSGINYAEYARHGFFELIVVSGINLIIILISKKFEHKDNEKEYNYIEIMNVIMVFLTLIIILSSFLRMNLYVNYFGFTTMRLLVYAMLICESLLLIPTSMYIFNSKFEVLKSYLVIIIASYVVLNFVNIDYMVARKNVNKYYATNKIDEGYLMNYGSDNIGVLLELYNNTTDNKIKKELKLYFNTVYHHFETDSLYEFNISKYNAIKKLRNIEDYKLYRD